MNKPIDWKPGMPIIRLAIFGNPEKHNWFERTLMKHPSFRITDEHYKRMQEQLMNDPDDDSDADWEPEDEYI